MNVKVTGDSRGVGKVFNNFLMESLPPPCSIFMMTSSTPIRARIGFSPLCGNPRSIFFRMTSSEADSSESAVIFWSRSQYHGILKKKSRSSPISHYKIRVSMPLLNDLIEKDSTIFALTSSWGIIPSRRAARKQKGRTAYSGVAVFPAAGSLFPVLPAAKLQGELT